MSVRVHLWAGLRRFAADQDVVEVEASTIGAMFRALSAAYPGLAPIIEDGVGVSVDGDVIRGNKHMPISETNEIHLIQLVKGG